MKKPTLPARLLAPKAGQGKPCAYRDHLRTDVRRTWRRARLLAFLQRTRGAA